MTTKFSRSPKALIKQLRKCDEALISGQTVDPDLDGNWGVDMVRKLQHWDIPGYLSRNAFPILQALGDYYWQQHGGGFTMEYVAVLSGEDDVNDTWRSKFDCASWFNLWPHATLGDDESLTSKSTNVEDGTLVTIPMYSEGFGCYLVIWARRIANVDQRLPIQPHSPLQ